MATFQRCDGCRKESPDSNGLHIANHWITIAKEQQVSFNVHAKPDREEILLCKSCAAVAWGAIRSTDESKSTTAPRRPAAAGFTARGLADEVRMAIADSLLGLLIRVIPARHPDGARLILAIRDYLLQSVSQPSSRT